MAEIWAISKFIDLLALKVILVNVFLIGHFIGSTKPKVNMKKTMFILNQSVS